MEGFHWLLFLIHRVLLGRWQKNYSITFSAFCSLNLPLVTAWSLLTRRTKMRQSEFSVFLHKSFFSLIFELNDPLARLRQTRLIDRKVSLNFISILIQLADRHWGKQTQSFDKCKLEISQRSSLPVFTATGTGCNYAAVFFHCYLLNWTCKIVHFSVNYITLSIISGIYFSRFPIGKKGIKFSRFKCSSPWETSPSNREKRSQLHFIFQNNERFNNFWINWIN